jgi:NTE family protein
MGNLPADVEVVALSGTSGGAICATLAWDGFLRNDMTRAIRKLQLFWDAMAAREPWDKVLNQWLMSVMALRDRMVLPEISPYQLPPWGAERMREMLEEHFDFAELRELARQPDAPALHIGAVEVLTGNFELFKGEEICAECLMASAAIPELYQAVAVPGRGMFWDGLFSQNPPIHRLVDFDIDEIWLIQINPTTCARVPTETHEILNRRNQLAGNLSMEQELSFIESINRALALGRITTTKYRPIRVSRISLDRELHYRTKLDRRPELLWELKEYGRAKWRLFLKDRESKSLFLRERAERAEQPQQPPPPPP